MYKNYLKAVNSLYGETIEKNRYPACTFTKSTSSGKKNGLKRHVEHGFQVKLVAWMRNQGLPVFSIPNEGNRGRLATHRLKEAGLWPGACDLFLFRPAKGYCGYFIEMKSPGEKPRANQLEFMARVRSEGYKAEWFDDLEKARQSVIDYLANKDVRHGECG